MFLSTCVARRVARGLVAETNEIRCCCVSTAQDGSLSVETQASSPTIDAAFVSLRYGHYAMTAKVCVLSP